MDERTIELILIDVIKKLTIENDIKLLDSQKLATSVFFSFVQGVLNNDEDNDEKIEDIKYCVKYINEHEKLFKDFGNDKNDL